MADTTTKEYYESGTNWGVGLIGGFIILLILFSLFSGNGWGTNNNMRACADISNCDVKTQGIINTATTQYNDILNADRVIANANDNTARLYDQAARQYDANQAEKLFDCKINAQTTAILNAQELASKDAKIYALEQRIYTDAQFADIRQELCQVPKQPRVSACVKTCKLEEVG